jgi:hypothetical protein
MKTSSKSNKIKKCYYLSIKDIIWNILNNPSLMQHMYFGPGQEVTHKSEYWHGNLWSESPLYGQNSITINNGKLLLIFSKIYYFLFDFYLIYYFFI